MTEATGARPAPEAPARTATPRLKHSKARSWIVWVVIVVAAIVGGRQLLVARRASPIGVRIHTVTKGTVRDYATSVTTGRLGAPREVTLRAEVAGTVRTMHHRRGDKVAAGEPLLAYDTAELRDRVAAAEAAVQVAKAQVAQADASAHLATDAASRAEALAKSGSIAKVEVETTEDQATVAARASAAARAGVHQAATSVELARLALSKSIVRAPFGGTVISTSVEEGDVTGPGTPLFSFADVSSLYAEAEVDEGDLARIALGMAADVVLDALPDERLHGKVIEIAPAVTRDARGSRSVAVRVSVPPDPRLRLGMSADIDVIVASHADVPFVPPNAVIGRGTQRSVYVVDGGFARKRNVEVGISSWESVEVKSGLVPGDRVIVSLAAGLADGSPVKEQP
jgi:HlyD family secretion protein